MIRMVSEMMKSLHPGQEGDQCLLRKLELEAVDLKAELADSGREIPVLQTGEQDLLDLEATLNKKPFALGWQK